MHHPSTSYHLLSQSKSAWYQTSTLGNKPYIAELATCNRAKNTWKQQEALGGSPKDLGGCKQLMSKCW